MSEPSPEVFLSQAQEKENEYDWLEAAELYRKALGLMSEIAFSKMGEVQEKIGHCYYRSAFQAEAREDFRTRIESASGAYEKAAELFARAEGLWKLARTNHCMAMVGRLRSLVARDVSRKKELLDDCWKLEKKAVDAYEGARDFANLGGICNSLMACLIDRFEVESEASPRERILDEGLKYGEKAIEIFSRSGDKQQLAQGYAQTAYFYKDAAFFRGSGPERREECLRKALSYPQKAVEISEGTDDAYLIGLSHYRLADAHLDIMGSTGLQERQHFEKTLQCGTLTKDNLLIAEAFSGLEFATGFSARAQEDPDKAREEYEKLDKYREDAVAHFNVIAHDAGSACAYCYGIIQIEPRSALETDPKSKRLLIEESVKLGYRGLDHARASGSMGVTFHMKQVLSMALVCLAKVETDTERKRSLLEESSKYTEESINILKEASACAEMEPRESNLASCVWSLALNQVELASMEKTIQEKTRMLQNAIAGMRSAREYWLKWAKSPWAHVDRSHWFGLGRVMMIVGKTLSELHALTDDANILGDVTKAFEESVELYGKADSPFSRLAEAYWELAKAYDKMGNFTESAKNFESASQNYVLAAEKIPQLKQFYQEHSSYMEAWNAIEKARQHHEEGQYGLAKEHYEKAANLHESTTRWNHLSLNYQAWARLEEGEDLSRREQTEEARDLFQQAAKLFAETEKSIHERLQNTESKEEKELLTNLAEASDIREEYCLGRIALEEARILDRQGDHAASSRRYGSAVEKFQKVTEALKDESDRRELKPIVCLCQAWQIMTRAEAEASSDLYKKASELFEEAKNYSFGEKAKMLALGHSCFCKALEAGTRFEAARDASLHTLATQHLEGAASYYLKAGFKNASEYAEATQKLLDAYLYMHNAKTETDPAKKAQLYMMAEKVLQASAGSYLKARHPEKQEQVSSLLEKVKNERELALSLTEVLHAPLVTSTTATFATPTPAEETPTGLELFEHADIQANIITRQRELKVGENFSVEVELVNAGKGPALLIKLAEVVPEGFEIAEKPEIYRVEDSYLNMKGKRLDPLKTEEVKLVLKPKVQGEFPLKPRILYLDENGKAKSYEPKPIIITVKELGIKGWLKGER